ncbi:sulfatase [Paraglaciecola chathamensis]|uniref:sulfatase family protein n=1 Tax=Paraglaciecola chathamensis TaxID=368405 RepID=UPI002709B3B0|nr:sulfatase [Paraglaciecola chathamensis]MDO6840198.1 sulfatase [Paraglaciecola chathamensis]
MKKNMHTKCLKLGTFIIVSSLLGCNAQNQKYSNQTAAKPNLIIIHTDEHNFRTISAYQKLLSEDQAFVWGKGNNTTTPNIDKIANQGAIATSYYASSPVCTPSRASLITGLYPQATGASKNGLHISEDIPTFATILRKQGYATSYVGKWHLAGHDKYSFGIKYKAGFEDNRYMMRGGHAPYFHIKDANLKGINEKSAAKLPKSEVIHATDFFTDKTLEILERDKDQPFAIMLSIPDPHTPDYAKPPYNTMYKDMNFAAPKTMLPEYVAIKPSWATDTTKNETIGEKSFENDKEALKQYFGMIRHIDDSVGRILKFLDDNHLTENTIIVFTSDHGDMFFEHNRRNKGVPFEASARVPFIIRYPNKIPAGKVLNTAYTNVDFTPTILSLMNVKTEIKFHGLDTANDFTNSDKEVNSDRITYYAKSGGWWVTAVNDRYKLVIDKNENPYLFDLEKDPNELINFYNDKDYSEIANLLQIELFKQLEKYDEPGLKINQAYVTE